MQVKEIRERFFNFFEKNDHQVIKSAPMVVKNDPTLMFTNAGMNQFKDIFLGNKPAKNSKVANTQKCLRVSGKHNDLEEVGVDTYHHTMFEMLGNWSFGDYFKKEAINWAWELLTEEYKIDKGRLYVTVFEGDEKDGLQLDKEAYDIWANIIAKDHILECDKKDNFWEMGEIGPCGPCSEIHVDIRSEADRKKQDGKELVNKDHPQVIEVWNLVFMEFNRMANGSLVNLPSKHVDTGMGLERLAMVLQAKQSNYDTDVFSGLINELEKLSNQKYGATDSNKDIAFRVIGDHLRAVSFSITDGQLPSNTGAGYVIRRILRRAIRYGYQFLELKEAFVYQLVDRLTQSMGDAFPELKDQKELIQKVIHEEEESFLRTLEKGSDKFYQIKDKTIPGKIAFELYDTFGFPIDLTQLMAREEGKTVDMDEFNKELQKQKDRSRQATKIETEDWVILKEDDVEEFIGYDHVETEVLITKYRKVKAKNKESYQLVFNITPFYAEGGGQVGDTGYIEAFGEKVSIFDTKRENNLIVHFAKDLPKNTGATFKAVINDKKRIATAANHSSTHLLHFALREVLGTHVEQKGSLVNADHLRFDFSHFSKVTEEELQKIENKVNQMISDGLPLDEKRAIPMSEAKELGAMALFGEKYGDLVRVIRFGESIELCGGIHVNNTSQIGTFKITSESSTAAGIRRIEAISSDKAREFVNNKLAMLDQVSELLKGPKDIVKSLQDLINEKNELTKKVEAFGKQNAKNLKQELLDEVQEMGGIQFIGKKIEADAGTIKDIAFQLKGQVKNLFAVLGGQADGKATLTIVIAENLVNEKGYDAGAMIRVLAKEIQGGGGGQKFFATAGGKNPGGLDTAIEKAKELV